MLGATLSVHILKVILILFQIFGAHVMAVQFSPVAFQEQVPSTLQALIPKVSADKDIQMNLNQLSAKGVSVSSSFRDVILNEGGDLLRLKLRIAKSLESGHCERQTASKTCESDIDEVHTSLSIAVIKFNALKSDVLSLQSSVEGNIEPCRGRKEEHERSATKTKSDIGAMTGQLIDFDQQVLAAEKEAKENDEAAGQLEHRANELKEAAKKKSRDGILGAVVGIVLALPTGGASLIAGGLFAGVNLDDASECLRQANNLRGAATAKRQHANNLRARRDTAKRQKTTLEANLAEKESQKVQFEKAAQSLQEVTEFLHGSSPVMDRVIRALQNVDVTIQKVKMETEAQQILLSALSNASGHDVRTSNIYVTTLKKQWTELESLLKQMGAGA